MIAQVERIAERGTLHPPAPSRCPACWWTFGGGGPSTRRTTSKPFAGPYNPAYAAEIRVPEGRGRPMPLVERKVIARRAALELRPQQCSESWASACRKA
ncbi:MAG: hypothetical protein IPF39_16295 [Comamonadaceae bacterium]|uniref:hypothetical protein n=1 Tax=Candidatus Skiveiella danica TaxID=3386177 RepID=UPI0039090166|nr:hypothetical protein [Comamonadaceae bacterium]